MTDWLQYFHAAARCRQDPTLSALLAVQLILIFIAEPLAFKDIMFPLVATGIITAGLFLLLVVGSHQRGTLIIVAIGGARLVTGALDLLWHTSLTAGAEAFSAVLALVAVIWAIFKIVFGPGHITSHRVRGAIVLYLTIAILFAWIYMLVAEFLPGAFSGLTFEPAKGALSPFLYYSLTSLTTIGFGDITPLDPFARNLSALEAVVGQLYSPIILARILTLYTDERRLPRQAIAARDASSEKAEPES